MDKKKLLFMPTILILAALACNAPATQASPADGSAATITALAATIQAQNGAGIVNTPANTAANTAAANTPTNTPLPTDTPTITLTPRPSIPTVTVSQTTNCRTGPGTVYPLLGSLGPGQSAQVVGKYTAGNYWIINTPGSSGTCWLWGQYATVSGNTGDLPEMVPPPTPTPAATATPALPAAPGNFQQTHSCTVASVFLWNVHVVLTWTDNAANETGYYLYRAGTLIVTLAPDSITYTENTGLSRLFILGHPAPSLSYSLRAFNSAGKSAAKNLSFGCP